MHESMQRLYMAAAELSGVSGQSNVARLLDELPQTVSNWERRGLSKNGAIKAQGIIGCSVNWLLDGTGSMIPPLIWPFKHFSPRQFRGLRESTRAELERSIVGAITIESSETRLLGNGRQ